MLGRMQDWPLLMHKVIDFAAIQFPEQQVASRTVEGPMHYTNYRAVRERALKVAKRLERDGIKLGDRVATLAWNGYRHLELYWAISGMGAVCHTVNPRLAPDDISYIMTHAGDCALFADLSFVKLIAEIAISVTMKCEPNQSSSWPLSSRTCNAPMPMASSAMPM